MLVLDGSPGAGKTTLLGHLLESQPNTLIVFPEAQPPPAQSGDAHVARALLTEDRDRVESAARLHELHPALQVASDRCHLGVLAYRYALVQTSRAPQRVLDHALALVDELHLSQGHRLDTVVILRLDPTQSLHRRAAHAHDGRYRLWYDPEFLTAYNDFLDHLRQWTPVGAHWVVRDATDSASWPSPLPTPHTELDAPVSPRPCGCADPRSALVNSHGVPTQLFPSAIHRHRPDHTIQCLRGAQEITTDWIAAHERQP